MSLEFLLLIGLWLVALTLTGVSLIQEVRARRLRGRVTKLVRSRGVALEEEQGAMVEDEDLKLSLPQRLLKAFLLPILHRLSRLFPQSGSVLKQTEGLLEMAGYPFGLSASDVMGLRLLTTVAGAVLGIFFPILASIWLPGINAPFNLILAVGIGTLAGFLGPIFWLRRAANGRRRRILRQLPDMLDLITLSIEAGLGFDGAVYEAARHFKGPLSDELTQVMREVGLGKARAQALRDMAERLKLEDISLLVSAVHQAETLGSPLADALKALAVELRKKRLRMIREHIAKLPVKLIFPFVLFIFPTLFIVILGPAVIQLTRTGLGG